MAATLTIRLQEGDRTVLESAANASGKGLSTYVRELAEAQAAELRRASIRAEGERIVAHLDQDSGAAGEVDALGTPQFDVP